VPRRRSLTPRAIAAAALRIVDRDGLALLSMRAVADELGVGAMSLYRYVEGRDELEGLVVEEVLREVDTEVPAEMAWRARVTTLADRVRSAVRLHPGVLPLLLTRRHRSESSIRWGEAVMRALADGGFEGKDRALAFRALLSYLIGAVQVEHFGPLSGPGTAALARLPPAQFPFLSDTARHAQRIDSRQEFLSGLEAVLAGLGTARAAAVRRRAASSPRRTGAGRRRRG
jgi:AcrR family transcriptional regulator